MLKKQHCLAFEKHHSCDSPLVKTSLLPGRWVEVNLHQREKSWTGKMEGREMMKTLMANWDEKERETERGMVGKKEGERERKRKRESVCEVERERESERETVGVEPQVRNCVEAFSS